MPVPAVVGLLLAAGEGRRLGRPKALVAGPDDVPWVVRSVRVLQEGGCPEVLVVAGAAAGEVEGLVAPLMAGGTVHLTLAEAWADGMGASLAAGLAALEGRPQADAAFVHLVDLPDVGADVIHRVLAAANVPGCELRQALVRAEYDGRPGHPVLMGRDHWAGVVAAAIGDRGARDYLASHPHGAVECGDLASGEDRDEP